MSEDRVGAKMRARIKHQFRRQRALDKIEQQKLRYEETGNPLFIFNAVKIASESSISIPQWIIEYWVTLSVKLYDKFNQAGGIDNGCVKSDVISSVMGLATPGRGGPISKAKNLVHDLRLAATVAAYMEAGHKQTYAQKYAADRHGVHSSTARRAYKKYGDKVVPRVEIE